MITLVSRENQSTDFFQGENVSQQKLKKRSAKSVCGRPGVARCPGNVREICKNNPKVRPRSTFVIRVTFFLMKFLRLDYPFYGKGFHDCKQVKMKTWPNFSHIVLLLICGRGTLASPAPRKQTKFDRKWTSGVDGDRRPDKHGEEGIKSETVCMPKP